jgi:hypothetical protein
MACSKRSAPGSALYCCRLRLNLVPILVSDAWSGLNGGCHPGRDVAGAIERAGLVCESKEILGPVPSLAFTRPWLKALGRPSALK